MKAGVDYIGVGLGVAIVNEKGEILLMKRSPKSQNEINTWALIGGRLEFGETMIEGIQRETMEEVGVEIEIVDQLPAYDHIYPEIKQHWIGTVFIAKLKSGTPTNNEPDKCEEIGWFNLESLPSPLADMSAKAIKYLQDKKLTLPVNMRN